MQRNDRIADEEFTARLQDSLRRTSSDAVRMRCLEQLADMQAIPDQQAVEELLVRTLQEDPNAVVRHEAAFVLGRIHGLQKDSISEEVLSALCESARTDPSIIVRHEATEVLGKLNDARILAVLRELAEDGNPDVSATAKIGLEHQGKHASECVLLK